MLGTMCSERPEHLANYMEISGKQLKQKGGKGNEKNEECEIPG